MTTLHTYDIHGIISVVSDAGLPELESFRVPRSIDEPTIRVRIGKPVKTNGLSANGHSPNGHALNSHSANGVERIKFSEWTGWHGFGIEITRGNTIEVSASSLLGKS